MFVRRNVVVSLPHAVPGGIRPRRGSGLSPRRTVALPDAASLQRTEVASSRTLEKIVMDIDRCGRERRRRSRATASLSGTVQAECSGFIFVQLKDWDERPNPEDHAQEIVASTPERNSLRDRHSSQGQPPSHSDRRRFPASAPGAGFSVMLQDRRRERSPAYLEEQTVQAFVEGRHGTPRDRSRRAIVCSERARAPGLPRHRRHQGSSNSACSLQEVNTDDRRVPGWRLRERLQSIRTSSTRSISRPKPSYRL